MLLPIVNTKITIEMENEQKEITEALNILMEDKYKKYMMTKDINL